MARKTTYINFFAPVNPQSISSLMAAVNKKLAEGTERFVVLISSPGGDVFSGLSAYNFLKGIPAEVITHNYGSVDSIGIIIFCAGRERRCVPNARFMMHGIGFNVPQGARFGEKQLDERIKSLRIDRENVAKVIAENCQRQATEIDHAMLEGTTLNPEQAKEYGLVHVIEQKLFPRGADVVDIRG